MIGLGLLIGLGILAFTRPRVRADADGIKIRNVVGSYDLPWSVVRAVRFDRNSPWATLELYDDERSRCTRSRRPTRTTRWTAYGHCGPCIRPPLSKA